MKTKLTLLFAVLLPLAAHAATDLSTALQKGLFEEEANQNLSAAIQAYQSLLAASDEQRKVAATALFRLGECYRKLGQTNEAVAQYQRLIRDFTDQITLATLSRQNLLGLGVSPVITTVQSGQAASSGMSSEARARLKELIQNEITVAKKFAAEQRKRIEAGTLPAGDAVRFERDVLGLSRQLVALGGLTSAADRMDWRMLLKAEIALAEFAAEHEQVKYENGKSVASEVARLQRDVLILKRELVIFESTSIEPGTSSQQGAAVTSVESEELARTERILAQLEGWDLGQVRRLLPTLAPDADFERYDRLLTEAQERLRTSNGEEREKWSLSADQYTAQLRDRFDNVKRMLQERIAGLRAQVREQTAEASRTQAKAGSDQSAFAARTAEAAQAQALLKQLQPMGRQELVRVLPTVAPDALLTSLLEQLAQTERKRAELKPSFAEGHPEVRAVEATLKLLNQQIAERIDGIMKGLEIKAAALKQ